MSSTQKRLAAKILKCGVGRVWIDPSPKKISATKVFQAITRSDIRGFISDDIIKKRPEKKRTKNLPKRQQRKGSIKGAKGARIGKKNDWFKKIRPQRRMIKELKNTNSLKPGAYRMLYMKVKGGMFRSKAHLQLYLDDKKLLEEKKNV